MLGVLRYFYISQCWLGVYDQKSELLSGKKPATGYQHFDCLGQTAITALKAADTFIISNYFYVTVFSLYEIVIITRLETPITADTK